MTRENTVTFELQLNEHQSLWRFSVRLHWQRRHLSFSGFFTNIYKDIKLLCDRVTGSVSDLGCNDVSLCSDLGSESSVVAPIVSTSKACDRNLAVTL